MALTLLMLEAGYTQAGTAENEQKAHLLSG